MKWLVVAALALAACKGKEGEYSGIGHWRFGVTVRKDAQTNTCFATTLHDGREATRCLNLQPIPVGKRSADVEAFFLGTAPDGPLIELQLGVRGCDEDEVDRFMRKLFGDPFETKQSPWREYWKNSYMWMLAQMPDAPAHCTVHFLPIDEKGEIERLSKLPEAKPEPKPDTTEIPQQPPAPPPDAAPAAAPPDAATKKAAIDPRHEQAVALANLLEAADDGHASDDMSARRPGADLAAQLRDVKENGGKQISTGGGRGGGGSRGGGNISGPGGAGTASGPPSAPQSPTGRITLAEKHADAEVVDPDLVVKKIVAAYMAGIKRCYSNYLKKDPSARGALALSFTVTQVGRVTDGVAKGFADDIDHCVQALTASWRFAIPKNKDGEAISAAFSYKLQLVPD